MAHFENNIHHASVSGGERPHLQPSDRAKQKEPSKDSSTGMEKLDSPLTAVFKSYHQIIEQHGSEARKESLDGGDPAVGVVRFYRQMHIVDGVTGYEDRLVIGQAQEKILRDLLAQKIPDVFVESRTAEFHPGEKESMKEIFDFYFPSRTLPSKLSNEQLVALSEVGAAATYRELTGARLHPTLTPEEYSRYVDPQLAQIQRGEEHVDTSREREQAAGREVMNFLQKNPGASVGLVFGAHHYFEQDAFMSPKGLPEIHDISWPGLHTTSPVGAAQLVTRLEAFPELQMEFLRRVTAIRPDCFPNIQTEAGQLLALEKMIPLHESAGDTTSFISRTAKDFFLNAAKSPRVKETVEKLYSQESNKEPK